MSKRDMLEKAVKAIAIQDEIGKLLDELKNEVLRLRSENNQLMDELDKYKAIEKVSIEKESVDIQTIDTVIEDNIPEVVEDKEVEVVKVVEETETITKTRKPILAEKVEYKPLISDENKKKIYEFFLGKNVILKIASVLFFLGFVTFGRMAYVNWLSDLERVILIFSVGAAFFGVGYVFDKKENIVFNNAFYITGLMLVYLSMILAHSVYELISYNAAIYISIVFLGIVFTYFYKKRYDFLDSFLFVFYVFILGYITFYGYDQDFTSIAYIIGITILYLQIVYVIYIYFMKFYNKKDILASISIGLMAIYLSYAFIGCIEFDTRTFFLYQNILLILFAIYFFYIINIKFLTREDYYSVVVVVATLLLSFTAGLQLRSVIEITTNINPNHVMLSMIVMLLPMYIYLYIEDETEHHLLSKIDIYGAVLSILLIIYTFTFGRFVTGDNTVPYYTHHIIFGVYTLAVYMFHRYTKKIFYLYLSRVVFVIFTSAVIIRFLSNLYSFVIENIGYNMSHTLYNNTEYLIYFSSLFIGISLITFNKLYGKYRDREESFDSLVFYGFNLMLTMPITLLIVDGSHLDIEERYLIVLLSSITYVFILYRYLLNFKVFNVQYLKEFKIGIQVLILSLITGLNFIYFDHDFGLLSELLVFFVVLVLNGYVVVALKEVFDYGKLKYNFEQFFIKIYLIGVFIQSMFIHRFINFDYDKVFLTSYFIIASSLAILFGFRNKLKLVRKLGLGAIYFSLFKFFIYDFQTAEFTLTEKMFTYFILSILLFIIAFMYAHLEKKYIED